MHNVLHDCAVHDMQRIIDLRRWRVKDRVETRRNSGHALAFFARGERNIFLRAIDHNPMLARYVRERVIFKRTVESPESRSSVKPATQLQRGGVTLKESHRQIEPSTSLLLLEFFLRLRISYLRQRGYVVNNATV